MGKKLLGVALLFVTLSGVCEESIRINDLKLVESRIKNWIAQLGENEYAIRTQATNALERCALEVLWGQRDAFGERLARDPGEAACVVVLECEILRPLKEAFDSEDMEVRMRVARILEPYGKSTRLAVVLSLAFIQAKRMGFQEERDRVLGEIIQCWMKVDPASAAKAVVAIKKIEIRDEVMGDVASHWVRTEPVKAEALTHQIQDIQERSCAQYSVAIHWAKTDPRTALQVAERIEFATSRALALHGVAVVWAKVDPVAAVEVARKIKEVGRRSEALRWVTVCWAKTDPAAAAALAVEIEDVSSRDGALKDIVLLYAEADFKAASALVKNIKNKKTRASIQIRLRRGDPSKTFEAAAERTLKIEDYYPRKEALHKVVRAWARKDASSATKWTATLKTEERIGAFLKAFEIWGKKDVKVAAKWAQEIEDISLREWAYWSLCPQLIKTDPALATSLAQQITQLESLRLETFHRMGRVWVKKDLKAATKWAMGLQKSRARDAVLAIVSEAWASKNPNAAWKIANLIEGKVFRSISLRHIANMKAKIDPVKAQQWADSLTDPKTRSTAQKGVREELNQHAQRKAIQLILSFKREEGRVKALLELAREIKNGRP